MNTIKTFRTLAIMTGISAVGLAIILGISGFFAPLTVREIQQPTLYLSGTLHQGPYTKTHQKLKRSMQNPDTSGDILLIFFDNPANVPSQNLRSFIGTVTNQSDSKATHMIPTTNVITISFPNKNRLSPITGLFRAVPKLDRYLTKHQIEKTIGMERYTSQTIQYSVPVQPINPELSLH